MDEGTVISLLLIYFVFMPAILIVVTVSLVKTQKKLTKAKKELNENKNIIEDLKTQIKNQTDLSQHLTKEIESAEAEKGENAIVPVVPENVNIQNIHNHGQALNFGIVVDGVNDDFRYDKWFYRQSVSLPNEYVAVDVETTGLSPKTDRIIEISLIKVADGKIVDEFTSFINPQRAIPERITELTGISDSDVEDAPTELDIMPGLLKFIEDDPIVAHNVSFDAGFLHYAAARCKSDFDPECIDTLSLSRRYLTWLPSKKLSSVCELLHINTGSAHRSSADALACHQCYQILRRFGTDTYSNQTFKASDFPPNEAADPNNPLYGQTVVFSGELASMSRGEALALVADRGGKPRDKVGKKTAYLVLGDLGNIRSASGADTSRKEEIARSYNAEGSNIQIITENQFLELIKLQ